MPENTNIYFFIIISLLAYIIYLLTYKSKEGFLSLDTVDVLPNCSNMSPDSLLQAFDFDVDRLSAVLVSLEINPNVLRDKTLYPKLASLLIQKGLLPADKCK
jgi:hypothetical protein